MKDYENIRVALVQDWLTELGGAEKVFIAINELFPKADIFTLAYNTDALNSMGIDKSKVKASFIQKLPFASTKYRNYLPLFTQAIESFDLSEYDLVISSSYAVAKGVLTHASQVHICYCHSPARYAWDLYHKYLADANLSNGLKGWVVKYYLHKLRIWDVISSNRVDHFISNSKFIANRINKVYHRKSRTIYPPVDVESFDLESNKAEFYITCSRFVPYKKIDIIVEAFTKMLNRKLIVIGTGPDFNKIKNSITDNVILMGYQPFHILKDYMQRAKAFVFAAEEDFGIVPVEAQACGTPIIAYGRGGIQETVIDGKTGIFFNEQTANAIIDAVDKFENTALYSPELIRDHSLRFSKNRFKYEFQQFVLEKLNAETLIPH